MWVIYAIIAAILWGFNYSLAEKILSSISPIGLLAIEMFTGALCFTIISYFTTMKQDFQVLVSNSTIRWLTLTEVVVVLVASFFIVSSIHLKNATVAGILELIYPLFTIFFTWLLFRQMHVNHYVIIGGILIFMGVIIISFA